MYIITKINVTYLLFLLKDFDYLIYEGKNYSKLIFTQNKQALLKETLLKMFQILVIIERISFNLGTKSFKF